MYEYRQGWAYKQKMEVTGVRLTGTRLTGARVTGTKPNRGQVDRNQADTLSQMSGVFPR